MEEERLAHDNGSSPEPYSAPMYYHLDIGQGAGMTWKATFQTFRSLNYITF